MIAGPVAAKRYAPDRFRHEALGDVGSTNTECLNRARLGDPGLLWITAQRQLQGRGRRGREWVSESGNLYASLLLVDAGPLDQIGSLPLVVAVAVHRAIERTFGRQAGGVAPDLLIKWPNDILLAGAKCCGILLESETLPNGGRAVIIGCGINIGHAPAPGLYPTICLREAGVATSPEALFAELFATMAEELSIWDGGAGVARIRDAWLARAAGVGQPITVNLPERSLHGVFQAIDERGYLLLETDAGEVETIAAGDVFFSDMERSPAR